jgi:hypothetical protein
MSAPRISLVQNATDTTTRDVNAAGIITFGIRQGSWRQPVERIRGLLKKGDSVSKGIADSLKKQLPAVMWSGLFSSRETPAGDKLITHSGLLCADLDSLGEKLPEIREKLLKSLHLEGLFVSPSGDGLKAVLRVPPDASKHAASFRAVERHVFKLTGVQIDQACKDVARLCFVSYDPNAYHNPNAVELLPLPEKEKAKAPLNLNSVVPDLNARQGRHTAPTLSGPC